MRKYIIKTLAPYIGYTVHGIGFKKKHYSLTRADALEWLACYDHALIYKGRKLHSERRTLAK